MSPENRISFVGIQELLVVLVLVVSNFGCGGGTSSTPPPAISVSVSAGTTTVQAGATTQVTATVTNDPANKGVTWTVSCSPTPCGAVSPSATASGIATTYAAPTTPPASNLTVTITATSAASASASASVTITVPVITVSVTPQTATLQAGDASQFSATVANDSATQGVAWALTQSGTSCSPSCGTVAPSGSVSGSPTIYTAPTTVPTNPMVTLTATSVSDTTKSAGATITIITASVEFVPPTLTLTCHGNNCSPPPQTTTLTNTGSTTLSISSITTTGSSHFSQTNTCASSVAAKGSCTITVTCTSPPRAGVLGAVSVSDNSGGSPQQVPLSCQKTGAGALEVRSAIAGHNTAAVPQPTGPSYVGTRVMDLVDSTRDDPFPGDGTKRELLVRFWYPASVDQGCEPAEYTSPAVWSYFSRLAEFPLPEVSTNSCLDAPVAGGAHPIIVFTHGYTGTFTDYTFLFEDLASRGYVVASVDHTFEATAVEFPDGRLVKSVFGSHIAESTWQRDGQSLTRALSARSNDLKFVVDELARLNGEASGPFAGKFDLTRVAIVGHSLGGLAALLSLKEEPRFKTAVLLDASVQDGWASVTKMPVLVLAMGREHWSDEECSLWRDLRGPRFAVNLKGAEHLTPSDAVWLAEGAIKTGPMGPEKTIEALRNYIAAFLDTNLRSKPFDPLLTGPSSDYPDAAVTTQKQLLCSEGTDH
jgi:dienelactone hydrolase